MIAKKQVIARKGGARPPSPAPHTRSVSGTHPRTWAEKEEISCREILFITLAEKWREGFDLIPWCIASDLHFQHEWKAEKKDIFKIMEDISKERFTGKTSKERFTGKTSKEQFTGKTFRKSNLLEKHRKSDLLEKLRKSNLLEKHFERAIYWKNFERSIYWKNFERAIDWKKLHQKWSKSDFSSQMKDKAWKMACLVPASIAIWSRHRHRNHFSGAVIRRSRRVFLTSFSEISIVKLCSSNSSIIVWCD